MTFERWHALIDAQQHPLAIAWMMVAQHEQSWARANFVLSPLLIRKGFDSSGLDEALLAKR
jgi:hypothetical protein